MSITNNLSSILNGQSVNGMIFVSMNFCWVPNIRNRWANRRIIMRLQIMLLNICVMNMHIHTVTQQKAGRPYALHNAPTLMHSTNYTGAPDFMAEVLGDAITLSCPLFNNDTVIGDITLSVKEWFHGPASNPNSIMARLVTKGGSVQNDFKAVANDKMWIDSRNGDLIIQNLTLEEAEFYMFNFTGSGAQTI